MSCTQAIKIRGEHFQANTHLELLSAVVDPTYVLGLCATGLQKAEATYSVRFTAGRFVLADLCWQICAGRIV